MTDAFRASANPADMADIDSVQLVLDQLVACANADDFARTAALFTDDYWRREIGGFPGRARALSRDARATPQPVPANQQMPRPVIVVARVLDDGRIGALVRFGVETSTDSNVDLVAFRRVEGQSRIDEVVTDYRQGIATPTARLQLS